MHKLPVLTGYHFKQLIYQGRRSTVYRAIQSSDRQHVVIKILNNSHPRFNQLSHFRHQFDSIHELNIPGIVKPISIIPFENKYALIMPDDDMISLHEFLAGKQLSLERFFPIAISLSKILGKLHEQRFIHKDVKPQNIIIHPETHEVKLIDFCIASILPNETQSLSGFNRLEGTLAYISPEQTGRMNRDLDFRSDYYSLGATFYECLTGEPPFVAQDALEMVHCHIARKPKLPYKLNSKIPDMLSQLIMKLLSKDAEERYQSSQGLIADLQQCQQQWQSHHRIIDFPLGRTDLAAAIQIPEKLYGREQPIQQLLQAFERVTEGEPQLVLVTGGSGIGKTALVNEIHKPLTRERGYFICGKFDQFNRDTPYSAISQALNDLVEQLLDESPSMQQHWKTVISTALGEQGQLLLDVIPALEQLIGPQSAIIEQEGEASTNRFHFLFQHFINVFSQTTHPLVLFLDDLQWLDNASLELLTHLMLPDSTQALLLIGAYRDNEVSEGHPLNIVLERFSQSKLSVNTVALSALGKPQLNQLIADVCHSDLIHSRALSQELYHKTQGNPFYVHQLLKLLVEEQLFHFNELNVCWDYDLKAIEFLETNAGVQDFLGWQLRKLPETTQVMLQLAATLGNQFNLHTLAMVSEQTINDCIDVLWPALSARLLLVMGDSVQLFQHSHRDYENLSDSEITNCRFSHDRVQQAAYTLISSDHRVTVHLKIGQLLQKYLSPAQQQERIFDIVSHLNQGRGQLRAPQEERALAYMNRQAGKRAQASTAYSQACDYYYNGIELLDNNAWDSDYELAIALHQGMVECAALQSDFPAQAHWSEILLAHSQTIHDALTAHQYHCLSLVAQGQPIPAIDYALPYLKQLGVDFPDNPTPEDIQQALA